MTFREPGLFPSSGKETPNLVDPLDRAILSHWASNFDTLLTEYTVCLCQCHSTNASYSLIRLLPTMYNKAAP